MRTLTEVFAPGSPSLPEGLRTLVASPDRIVEPGTTVRASFAFNNLGGAAATGMRVRFALPEGLRYLAGSAKIDAAPIDEARGETALLAPNGADIGEVPPGVERRITIAFLVNPKIENGAVIELQAALASHETGVIGSNVVRLIAKSTPLLQHPSTVASIEAVREAEPGEEVRVTARVHNAGQSSATDVIVVLPVPDRTTYVPGSARIDGRDARPADDRSEPFGYARAPIAAHTLAAGATLVVEYRAKIDSPLENNTRLFVAGHVACAQIAEFDLARAELTVRSAANFDGTETALIVDAPSDVEPGRRIRLTLAFRNTGTCAADNVRAGLTLPDGLRYAPGSRVVDGRSVGESETAGTFTFDRIEAGQRREVAVDAYVVSPAADGRTLPVLGSLQWPTGSRTFDRTLTIRSKPQFLEARNALAFDGSTTVVPGADVRVVLRIANDGTAPATNARVAIEADAALQSLRYGAGDAQARVQNGLIALGALEANATREIVLIGTIASPIADRSEIRLSAMLLADETAPVSLGTVTCVTRSRPRFSPATSHLAPIDAEPLRPNGTGDIAVVLTNDGTDTARDIRLALDLTADARIDRVDGATREGDQLVFGDIPAGGHVEATLRIRLGRFVARGASVTVHARLAGVGLLPVALEPIVIPTLAEPGFADGAQLRTQPIESVDAGEAMYVQLSARNTGDGSASRLVVRAILPEHTAYVPGSTSINDVPLLDAVGGSILWSKSGLVLEDVDPGVEIGVRYAVIINTPLAAGTLIAPAAELAWDGGVTLPLAASSVRVRSTPAFAVRASGLPFSVAGVAPRTADALREVAQSPLAAQRALAAPLIALPRAVPVMPPPPAPRGEIVEGRFAATPEPPPPAREIVPAAIRADAPTRVTPAGVRVRLTFTRESLERALAFLDQSDYGGLVSHFFVLRTLFPEGVTQPDADVQASFTAERDALRAVVDRLFIKMRMPRYVLTAKDIEDRAARVALIDLVGTIARMLPQATGEARTDAPIAIEGELARERIVALRESLESEPLGAARPWLVLAEMLGSVLTWPGGSSDAPRAYRDALIATLTNAATLPIQEFHRVLTENSNVPLDAALVDLRAALRSALAAATVTELA